VRWNITVYVFVRRVVVALPRDIKLISLLLRQFKNELLLGIQFTLVYEIT